eukprot:357783-Chlamydomonas_euryale.AAC.1
MPGRATCPPLPSHMRPHMCAHMRPHTLLPHPQPTSDSCAHVQPTKHPFIQSPTNFPDCQLTSRPSSQSTDQPANQPTNQASHAVCCARRATALKQVLWDMFSAGEGDAATLDIKATLLHLCPDRDMVGMGKSPRNRRLGREYGQKRMQQAFLEGGEAGGALP